MATKPTTRKVAVRPKKTPVTKNTKHSTKKPMVMRGGDKYNLPRHKLIVEALRQGNYHLTAAQLAGISQYTLKRWLVEGERELESPYRALYEDCIQAEAEAEARLVSLVAKAAEREWTAAMTLLERRWPSRYSRKTDVTVSGDPDAPITVATHHILHDVRAQELHRGLLAQLAAGSEGEEADVIDALP